MKKWESSHAQDPRGWAAQHLSPKLRLYVLGGF